RGAVREEAALDTRIGPVEAVDADRRFGRRETERHSDEEAAFEGADFDQRTYNAELRLASDEMSANGGGEARRHAAHALIALGKVAVDDGMAACDIDHLERVPLTPNRHGRACPGHPDDGGTVSY